VVFDRVAHISLAYHKPMVADETPVETIAWERRPRNGTAPATCIQAEYVRTKH
jgi:hypothetical protein